MVEYNVTGVQLHPNPLNIYTWANQFTIDGSPTTLADSAEVSPAGGIPFKVTFPGIYAGAELNSYATIPGDSDANITAISPGEAYRVSIWAKGTAGTEFSLLLWGADSSGSTTGSNVLGSINYKIETYTLTTTWTQYTFDVVLNSPLAENLQTSLYFYSPSGGGSLWFDGYEIYKLSLTYDVVSSFQYSNKLYSLYNVSPTQFFQGLTFKPDGRSFVTYNRYDNEFYQVDLDVAWDLSSAVFRNKLLDLKGLSTSDEIYYHLTNLYRQGFHISFDSEITDLRFNSNGTKLIFMAWVAWRNELRLFSLKLNTPYDISSCDLTGSSSTKGHEMVELYLEIPGFSTTAGYIYSTVFFNQFSENPEIDGTSFTYLKHINNSPVWQYSTIDSYDIKDMQSSTTWSNYNLTPITGGVPLLSSNADLADDYRDGPSLYARQYYNSVYMFARNSEIYPSELTTLPIYRIDTDAFNAVRVVNIGEMHRGDIEDIYFDFGSSKMFALSDGIIYEYSIVSEEITVGTEADGGAVIVEAPPTGGQYDSDDPSYNVESILAEDGLTAGALVDSAENEVDFAFPISMDASRSKIEFTNTAGGGGGYEFDYNASIGKFQFSGINDGNQVFSVSGNSFFLGLDGSEYSFPTSTGSTNQFLRLNASNVLEFVDLDVGATIDTSNHDGNLILDENGTLYGGSTIGSLRYKIGLGQSIIYQASSEQSNTNDYNRLDFVDDGGGARLASIRTAGAGFQAITSTATNENIMGRIYANGAGGNAQIYSTSDTIRARNYLTTSRSGAQQESTIFQEVTSSGSILQLKADQADGSAYSRVYLGTSAQLLSYSNSSNQSYIQAQGSVGRIRFYVETNNNIENYYLDANGWFNASDNFIIQDNLDVTGNITTDGNISADGNITAFASSSDIRLKENIEKINNGLNKVNQLSGYTFNYKERPDERHTGLIAQEVMEVLPEVVYDKGDGTYALRYGNVVGLLVEAIKELTDKVEKLENELNGTTN